MLNGLALMLASALLSALLILLVSLAAIADGDMSCYKEETEDSVGVLSHVIRSHDMLSWRSCAFEHVLLST